jgi:hypothetical protein
MSNLLPEHLKIYIKRKNDKLLKKHITNKNCFKNIIDDLLLHESVKVKEDMNSGYSYFYTNTQYGIKLPFDFIEY